MDRRDLRGDRRRRMDRTDREDAESDRRAGGAWISDELLRASGRAWRGSRHGAARSRTRLVRGAGRPRGDAVADRTKPTAVLAAWLFASRGADGANHHR